MLSYFGICGNEFRKGVKRLARYRKKDERRINNQNAIKIDPSSRRGLSPHIAKDIGWLDPFHGKEPSLSNSLLVNWLM